MSKIGAVAFGIVATIAVCSFGSIANAFLPSELTFVAPNGTDGANDCLTITTPCKTVAFTLSKTRSNGIMFVAPGAYQEFVNVDRGVQMVANGGEVVLGLGSNTCPSGLPCTAILINAQPTDVVRLHGITIHNSGDPGFAGSNGSSITFVSGAALILEDCVLTRADYGIYISPNVAASVGPTSIKVHNCAIDGNNIGNVLIAPRSSVAVNAVFDQVTMSGSVFGLKADNTSGSGKIRVDARDSVANDNATNGFISVGTGATPIHFFIERSTATGNGAFGAVAVGAQSFMIVGNSSLIGNATGLAQQTGSTVATFGNNGINFNTTNTSGTITPIAQK